jgi:hypothetical protein
MRMRIDHRRIGRDCQALAAFFARQPRSKQRVKNDKIKLLQLSLFRSF